MWEVTGFLDYGGEWGGKKKRKGHEQCTLLPIRHPQ